MICQYLGLLFESFTKKSESNCIWQVLFFSSKVLKKNFTFKKKLQWPMPKFIKLIKSVIMLMVLVTVLLFQCRWLLYASIVASFIIQKAHFWLHQQHHRSPFFGAQKKLDEFWVMLAFPKSWICLCLPFQIQMKKETRDTMLKSPLFWLWCALVIKIIEKADYLIDDVHFSWDRLSFSR